MKNNKGFSLVELIIVIAIMAILVGVMAPQLIRYIEKTKESSDVQLLDTVRSAVTTAILDPTVVTDSSVTIPTGQKGLSDFMDGNNALNKAIQETLGATTANQVQGQLKSKICKGKSIKVEVKNGNTVVVTCETLTVGGTGTSGSAAAASSN